MRLTNRDKSNLARFGCSFLPQQNLIVVPWLQDEQMALASRVLVRSIHGEWPSGPLVCLAFEISPTKASVQYCFFPFDVTDKSHAKYLATVVKQGKIRLCFLTAAGSVMRIHELAPHQCTTMADLFASSVAASRAFQAEKYDYQRAVSEFERSVRLVDQFQYVLTQAELDRVIALFENQAENASPEARIDATKIAEGLVGAFRPQYKGFVRPGIGRLPNIRRSLLFLLDLHHRFENDYDGFVKFVANAIAAHSPQDDNEQLKTATLFFQSVFRLIDDIERAARNEDVPSAKLQADFQDLMARLVAGQGLSIKALTNLLSAVGVPVRGQPGRTPEDYSIEYEIRASGRPWRAAAEWTLANDLATREEFGGRNYASLTSREKWALVHRTKEGVRVFAQRTGKPFPPRSGKSS